ncbi:MAG: RNA 2',3'-cyclic phosphodiesterase [Alphaproteobacteria bacterium]
MIRLFVGLALPDALRDTLAMLHTPIAGARWVPRENLHLTLHFIGEVDPRAADEIDIALGHVDAAAFELTLEGVGQFASRRRVRALWAGVARNEALERLQARVETACRRLGHGGDGRRFTPHVTLARCPDLPEMRVAPFFAAHGGFAAAPVEIDAFALFSSTLGSDGPVYRSEASYPLEGGAGRWAELAAEWDDVQDAGDDEGR